MQHRVVLPHKFPANTLWAWRIHPHCLDILNLLKYLQNESYKNILYRIKRTQKTCISYIHYCTLPKSSYCILRNSFRNFTCSNVIRIENSVTFNKNTFPHFFSTYTSLQLRLLHHLRSIVL